MFNKYSNGELVNKAKGVKPVRVFTLTPELHELIVHYMCECDLKLFFDTYSTQNKVSNRVLIYVKGDPN